VAVVAAGLGGSVGGGHHGTLLGACRLSNELLIFAFGNRQRADGVINNYLDCVVTTQNSDFKMAMLSPAHKGHRPAAAHNISFPRSE
jgi:hypothetical protein